MTPKEMALTAAKALDEKKGGDIAAIEITEQTTLADYFVIATGNSNTQINALCGAVEKAMKEQAGEDPLRREGYRDGTWVLLDYGCVVVTCSPPRPGSSIRWSGFGTTASRWISPVC